MSRRFRPSAGLYSAHCGQQVRSLQRAAHSLQRSEWLRTLVREERRGRSLHRGRQEAEPTASMHTTLRELIYGEHIPGIWRPRLQRVIPGGRGPRCSKTFDTPASFDVCRRRSMLGSAGLIVLEAGRVAGDEPAAFHRHSMRQVHAVPRGGTGCTRGGRLERGDGRMKTSSALRRANNMSARLARSAAPRHAVLTTLNLFQGRSGRCARGRARCGRLARRQPLVPEPLG